MAKVTDISSSGEFQKVLGGNKNVIVDFYATWFVIRIPSRRICNNA
jgi:hypothetical protein